MLLLDYSACDVNIDKTKTTELLHVLLLTKTYARTTQNDVNIKESPCGAADE